MIEKRFTIKEFSTLDAMSSLDVICDNSIELPSSTACDLLNELSEENEQLKKRIEYLERKIQRERNSTQKQYEKWEKEALEKINKLEKENGFLTIEVEALKQIKPIKKLPQKLTVLKLDDDVMM